MEPSAVIGILALVLGLTMIAIALPITHRLVRLIPQWSFSRGDVERIGSTTFAMVLVGCLIAISGLLLLVEDLFWS